MCSRQAAHERVIFMSVLACVCVCDFVSELGVYSVFASQCRLGQFHSNSDTKLLMQFKSIPMMAILLNSIIQTAFCTMWSSYIGIFWPTVYNSVIKLQLNSDEDYFTPIRTPAPNPYGNWIEISKKIQFRSGIAPALVCVRACVCACLHVCVYLVCVCMSSLFVLEHIPRWQQISSCRRDKVGGSGSQKSEVFFNVLQPGRFQRKLFCYHK